MLAKALAFSHQLLKNCIQAGDTVMDATLGNGYDTLFLAELVGKNGSVYGFDIQKKAIEQTQQRLEKAHINANVQLHQIGHECAHEIIPAAKELKAIIFNLGYLPNGDKSIITKAHSTILAMENLLPKLSKGGRMIFVVYHGHFGGNEEKNLLLEKTSLLPQKDFDVLLYQFLNQKNQPPLVIAIEKK